MKLTDEERKIVEKGRYWSHWCGEEGRPDMLVDMLVKRMYEIHGSDAVRIDRYHRTTVEWENDAVAKDFALRYLFDCKSLSKCGDTRRFEGKTDEDVMRLAEEDLKVNMVELESDVYDDATGFLGGKRAYAYCADGIAGCLDFYAIFDEKGKLVSFSEHSD